eukprot:9348379-Alexandrium_andersonii.AAC.2
MINQSAHARERGSSVRRPRLLGKARSARLAAQGQRAVLVTPGQTFGRASASPARSRQTSPSAPCARSS